MGAACGRNSQPVKTRSRIRALSTPGTAKRSLTRLSSALGWLSRNSSMRMAISLLNCRGKRNGFSKLTGSKLLKLVNDINKDLVAGDDEEIWEKILQGEDPNNLKPEK